MELTDNDRQRIEQEAIGYRKSLKGNDHVAIDFIKGAEYATRYEREQQANGLKSIENPDHHIKVLKEQIQRMEKEYKELEAERTELRNKVIEEMITELHKVTLAIHTRRHIIQLLNSLKTK